MGIKVYGDGSLLLSRILLLIKIVDNAKCNNETN